MSEDLTERFDLKIHFYISGGKCMPQCMEMNTFKAAFPGIFLQTVLHGARLNIAIVLSGQYKDRRIPTVMCFTQCGGMLRQRDHPYRVSLFGLLMTIFVFPFRFSSKSRRRCMVDATRMVFSGKDIFPHQSAHISPIRIPVSNASKTQNLHASGSSSRYRANRVCSSLEKTLISFRCSLGYMISIIGIGSENCFAVYLKIEWSIVKISLTVFEESPSSQSNSWLNCSMLTEDREPVPDIRPALVLHDFPALHCILHKWTL